jgi:release factor glutamine methyltransferase
MEKKTLTSIGEWLSISRSNGTSLEAQVLLADLLGRSRSWVLAHPEAELSPRQSSEFEQSVGELQRGTALPYLLGWWEFYGRRFRLTPEVLIPRPETELMVETALHAMQGSERVLDVGTGSGCVAVTLAAERPESTVAATDLSFAALRVARSNAGLHGVQDRVHLLAADLMGSLIGQYDLICANLPYVASAELRRLPVGRREPQLALDGGQDGLELIRRALAELPARLRPEGMALFEIDPRQSDRLMQAAQRWFGPKSTEIRPDLSGRPRLLMVRNE